VRHSTCENNLVPRLLPISPNDWTNDVVRSSCEPAPHCATSLAVLAWSKRGYWPVVDMASFTWQRQGYLGDRKWYTTGNRACSQQSISKGSCLISDDRHSDKLFLSQVSTSSYLIRSPRYQSLSDSSTCATLSSLLLPFAALLLPPLR
jgi:hypothetical protein